MEELYNLIESYIKCKSISSTDIREMKDMLLTLYGVKPAATISIGNKEISSQIIEKLKKASTPFKSEEKENYTRILLANSNKVLNQLIEATDETSIGKILGYPKCCISHYVVSLKNFLNFNQDTPYTTYLNNLRLMVKAGRKIPKELAFISHIPCSLNCKKTLKIGKVYMKTLKQHMPILYERIILDFEEEIEKIIIDKVLPQRTK